MKYIATLVVIFMCTATTIAGEEGKLGVVIVAHGASPAWNSQVEEPAKVFDDKHQEIVVEPAFLTVRGEAPTPQIACDRLVSRGATRIVVLPLFISSHSSHYDEILYIFGKINNLKYPEGMEDHERPKRVKSSIPVLDVLTAVDDSEFAAMQLVKALHKSGADKEKINLVLVAHGPNSDEHARIWLKNMEGLMKHVVGKLDVGTHKCLLVRDDADKAVRNQAVADIRESVKKISATGKTYVMPLLIANGHLSREIPKMFEGASSTYIEFNLAGSESVEEYFYQRIKSFLR